MKLTRLCKRLLAAAAFTSVRCRRLGAGHQARLQRRPLGLAVGAERPGRGAGNGSGDCRHQRRRRRARQKLTLITRDDVSQPPKSIQNMSDLVDNEKVVAVFGPTNSGNAMAWKHIANQKKVPVLGNVGSGTDITKPMSPGADNYMFRVSMVDREQVAALMAYVKKNAATSKVIGLMAETTGYGQGGLKDMEEIAALQGIKPAAIERFGVGDTDMTSQLSKMKSAGVDTVVVWAQGTPIAQLIRSMEKINYFPLTLTSWAADNITFYDAAGKTLAEKPIFMRTVSETKTPAQQKLFDRIGSKLKAPGSFSFALHGYDSVLILTAGDQAGQQHRWRRSPRRARRPEDAGGRASEDLRQAVQQDQPRSADGQGPGLDPLEGRQAAALHRSP